MHVFIGVCVYEEIDGVDGLRDGRVNGQVEGRQMVG